MNTRCGFVRVLVCGVGGRMGNAICETVRMDNRFEVVAGVSRDCSRSEKTGSFDVYSSFKNIDDCVADVIIDFSHSDVTEELLDFSLRTKIPAVIGTTGQSKKDIAKIHAAASSVPVFYSSNMSVGVNILLYLCKKAPRLLKDNCDVEIVEKHHRMKRDAPSGTALMIANTISKSWGMGSGENFVFDRSAKKGNRRPGEIGVSSVRAGTIVGEHDIIFGLDGETITLRHTAQSREIFAKGALLAAEFILGKPAKLYTMDDLCSIGDLC